MKNLILILVIVVAAAGAWYFAVYRTQELDDNMVTGVEIPGPAPNTVDTTPPPEQFPVPTADLPESADDIDGPASQPRRLPQLDDSDFAVKDQLSGIHDIQKLEELFIFDSIIRYFVVTVDNMTAPLLPQKFRFYSGPRGTFAVEKIDQDNLLLNPVNYARYTPYVKFLEALDLRAVAGIYFNYYPLFQQAYVELGYPDRYFNDRLVTVIEHLLQTPEVEGAISLKQPKVYYTFADPWLEALSAGQKILVRMGPEHSRSVKQRLRELLGLLTGTQAIESGR